MYSYQKQDLKDIYPKAVWSLKCIDDEDPTIPLYRPRGQAGVGFIWHPKLDPHITVLPDGSDRVIAMRIQTNEKPIVIINTYMPASGTHTKISYNEIADEVHEILQKYQPYSTVIWVGDMNGDVGRNTSANDKALKKFCKSNELKIADMMPNQPTYHHFNGTSKSSIDLIIHPETQSNIISSIHIEARHPLNTSTHDAVIVKTNQNPPTSNQNVNHEAGYKTASRKIKWDKVDMAQYKDTTDKKISLLLDTMENLPTQVAIERINTIMSTTAEECSPAPRRPGKSKTFKWAPTLKPIVEETKRKFGEWKDRGKQKTDPLYQSIQRSKKELRSTQKQIMAQEREARHKQIMDASENDHTLLYQLIRRQRNDGQDNNVVVKFKFDPEGRNNQVENWATYFEALATPKELPQFDKEHKTHMETKRILLQLQMPTGPPPVLTTHDMRKHIDKLKNGKAPDLYGIAPDHIKNASPNITEALTNIANKVYQERQIPEVAKVGIITPVIKKKKAKDNPDNYRRITVTSMVGKLIDRDMIKPTRSAMKQNNSKRQFGFKEGMSCNNASLLITEAAMDAKDKKIPIYTSFMDTSKAFDMVNHNGLLCALEKQGVHGHLWHMYDTAYDGIKSAVKWQGSISRNIDEQQGIRQGGDTSADAFNTRAENILHKYDDHPDGFKIGTTSVGAVMVADDLALASKTPHGLQALVDIAEYDASTQQYIFSETKTKVQTTNSKKTLDPNIKLNGVVINTSDEEVHLGIHRRADTKNSSTVDARIQTARRTIFALAGAGVYGFNGVSPITSKKLLDIYVLPRLTYGLETLTLKSREIEPMETFYRESLRRIQSLPQTTANAACYLLIGAIPVEAIIHIKTLTLFGNIMRDEKSLEYEVMEYQLATKDSSSHSWAIHIQKLLYKYDLPRASDLMYVMKSKQMWKQEVKSKVIKYWMEQLKADAEEKKTLCFLNLDWCLYNQPHPIWLHTTTDPLQVHRAAIHVQCLVQRYPISTSHTAKHKSQNCPCCNKEAETMEHFVLKCQAHAISRSKYMPQIIATLTQDNIQVCDGNIMQAIMDPTVLSEDWDTITSLTLHARIFLFHLHRGRSASFKQTVKAKNLSASGIKKARNILTYREPTIQARPSRVRPPRTENQD